MSSLGLLEANINIKCWTTYKIDMAIIVCGFGIGLVVVGGKLVVGGGSCWGCLGGVCTCDGFQKVYDDLTT